MCVFYFYSQCTSNRVQSLADVVHSYSLIERIHVHELLHVYCRAEGAKRLLAQCRLCSSPVSAVFRDLSAPAAASAFDSTVGARACAGVRVPPAPDVPIDCWLARVERLLHALTGDSLAALRRARAAHPSGGEFDQCCSELLEQVVHRRAFVSVPQRIPFAFVREFARQLFSLRLSAGGRVRCCHQCALFSASASATFG